VSGPGQGLIVLDDDPTGTQAAAGVRVLLDLGPRYLRHWFRGHEPQPVYLLTNTRALDAGQARDLIAGVCGVVREEWPHARIVLRGDSTLRGHLRPEYEGIAGSGSRVLLVVPAMPAAGRVTIGGTHFLVERGRRVPVSATEYARDKDFGYSSPNVLAWAQERSDGLFRQADGRAVPLADLRDTGAPALTAALAELAAAGRPAVCACDAETTDDLQLIAAGLRQAWQQGLPVAVRCAPPLAAILADHPAHELHPPPAAAARLLAVVGSYVQASTNQLAEVVRRHPGRVVEADIGGLLADPLAEASRLAGQLTDLWQTGPLAVLATPRGTPDAAVPGIGVARGLAQAVASLPERPAAVVTRGGITSAVTATHGLLAQTAWVDGPVRPGIAMWHLDTPAGPLPQLIAAGNVGEASDLADLLDDMVAGAPPGRSLRCALLSPTSRAPWRSATYHPQRQDRATCCWKRRWWGSAAQTCTSSAAITLTRGSPACRATSSQRWWPGSAPVTRAR
jgi:uncharacterized protein YgbK (DUF1537 family)